MASLYLFLMAACTLGPSSLLDPREPKPETLPDRVRVESEKLEEITQKLQQGLEKVAREQIEAEPVMPVYDPLEDRIVSFTMVNEGLEMVLYSLSQAVGMNLIIDPAVNAGDKKLTLNFEKVSASNVLKEVLNSFDLYYEVDENVIRIKPFQERVFKLNFLDTHIETDFIVGGDVLGSGEDLAVEGLSGTFKLTGKGADRGSSNPYDVIESMLKKIISKNGKYSLNRLAGNLYVQDSPANIEAVTRIINHTRDMLSRQILIEARLIEVVLSDEYKYGIDWDIIRQDVDSKNKRITAASFLTDSGLTIQGIYRHFSFDVTLDTLNTFGDTKVISNPSIRSKHGQPAVISVGTSISYTKSTETTQTSGDNATTTTEVEVSKVFDGLILGVIPFIEEDGKITLLINPIKSDVDRTSLALIDIGNQRISLPQVNIKEISTTIALKNGDVVILGGLIDKREITENSGVPILSSIPLLGYLFKDEFKSEENRELVIILSVSLV